MQAKIMCLNGIGNKKMEIPINEKDILIMLNQQFNLINYI